MLKYSHHANVRLHPSFMIGPQCPSQFCARDTVVSRQMDGGSPATLPRSRICKSLPVPGIPPRSRKKCKTLSSRQAWPQFLEAWQCAVPPVVKGVGRSVSTSPTLIVESVDDVPINPARGPHIVGVSQCTGTRTHGGDETCSSRQLLGFSDCAQDHEV